MSQEKDVQTRLEIATWLEKTYLNKVIKYQDVHQNITVGKIDKIAYENFQGGLVSFVINNKRFECDLDWLKENMIIL